MSGKSKADVRREFQAKSSLRQWAWFGEQFTGAAIVFGVLVGVPLALFGVSWKVIAGIVWIIAAVSAISVAADRMTDPEKP